MTLRRPQLQLIEIAVALTSALLAFTALTYLAQGEHQSLRLAKLETQAMALGKSPRRPPISPDASLCRQSLDAGIAEAGSRLRDLTSNAGLELSALAFERLNGGLPTDLVGASLELKIDGDERQLTAFLKAASVERLPIFLDAVDIAPSPSGVSASLHGRILCKRGY